MSCFRLLSSHRFLLIASMFFATGCTQQRGELFPAVHPPFVWPAPPDAARIRYVGAILDTHDLKPGRTMSEGVDAALHGPRPPIKLVTPTAVAVQRPNLLAITDIGAVGVHIIDLESRNHVLVSGWAGGGGTEDSAQRLSMPVSAAWIGDRLFVSDAKRAEIIEFTPRGDFVRAFGHGVLSRPVGIATAGNKLYVVDGGAHCIRVFDEAGRSLSSFGQRGARPGEFNFPSHVCVRGNQLLVADSGNFRVQLLDLSGRHVLTIGQKGDAAGDLALPKGVAFDGNGQIYIVDAQFENVQVFDQQGRLLMALGEEGRAPGQFWLPAGLAIDAQNRMWIADSGNRRVQVFDYLGLPPGER